jgi:hypothetical protein
MAENEKAFKIYGKVIVKESGQGIPNVIVEALDKDLIFDDRLGSVITDEDGVFQILYNMKDFKELFFDLKPDIYLRVRKSDGTIIHTTEEKVRYEAGKTEAFHISISKSLIGEEDMGKEKLADYTITGKVSPDDLKKISTNVPIVAYGIRDRRVIGHGPVKEDGSFEIHYKYKVFGKDKEPYGVDLVIGPELPGDQILKTKLERKFLSSKGFKPASPKWKYEIDESIHLGDKWHIEFDRIKLYMNCEFTYTGFVYTCSPLNIPPGGQAGCVDQEALSCPGGDVEAYVRLSRGSHIIAEDIEINMTGKFETTIHWHSFICLYIWAPVTVEVYQKTDTGEHTIYTGDHYFSNNIAQDIFIDRDKTEMICTPPDPTPGTGNFFGFERVGNIPVEAIYKEGEVTGEFGAGVPVPDAFVGYVNSVDKPGVILGDADTKVKDYALFHVLHFYGNIGENFGTPYTGGVDMSDVSIKYFRIKYSYVNPETTEIIGDTYISVPFDNTRKITGGTTTESMKVTTHPVTGDPLAIPTYIYPNPYETNADKDWKYRGLMLVFNTSTLPRKYGRYTFTIEPLDADMNPVTTIADTADCVLSLLIDNDHGALTGEIENILRQTGAIWVGTNVCEVVDLTGTPAGNSSNIKVEYNLNHSHGNLRDYKLSAKYGKDHSVSFGLVGNTYSRSGMSPYWYNVDEAAEENLVWQKCAYEFRLEARRRVTNGFTTKWWEEFTYHVMIDSNNPYTS